MREKKRENFYKYGFFCIFFSTPALFLKRVRKKKKKEEKGNECNSIIPKSKKAIVEKPFHACVPTYKIKVVVKTLRRNFILSKYIHR